MPNVLFAASDELWDEYAPHLRHALDAAGVEAELSREMEPEQVDYIVYSPGSWLQDFAPYTRCKAVLNLWAGVEKIVGNESLTQPLARMVDHGLTQGMVEYVTGHVLRHHLNIDHFLAHQAGEWARYVPPLAGERPVGMLGLGALGTACGQALAGLGFPVTGWSRTPKRVEGLTCVSGPDGLREVLSQSQILVLLLPLTEETENLLDEEKLGWLPEGAMIVNPGRGPLIDDDALLRALDTGRVAHATLDVFREEPLPADHAFWNNAKVTVTPHIASETRASTASEVIAENVRRGEAREPFLHLVDRERGY